MTSFEQSLDEVRRFAEEFRLVQEETERKFEEKLRAERKRTEELSETNRSLTEELEKALETRLDLDQKYRVNSSRTSS